VTSVTFLERKVTKGTFAETPFPFGTEQRGEKHMIQITMNNGCYDEWKSEQYTDYMYDGKCFIIIKGEQWVGIYNMGSVRRIVVNQ